ncbi:hypothetical protein BX600DRAFT_509263 [Xylariales sp. PMI_506]|nr:hypothetical protein BX600DRAFT_509263 [Xylariales sp. PMI_506]
METSLSDQETRFVLGEMIKASSVDVPLLAEFIKAHNIEQNWMHMQLPTGRNMYQCMGALEKILPVHLPSHPNLPSLKRKSVSDASDQQLKRQIVVTPIESAVPPRNIQPRPPPFVPNGFASVQSGAGSPSVTSTGKKRGRPSKADKEAQARANYSRSMEFAPITPAPAPLAPHREYASSPGYEIAPGNPTDQRERKRGRPEGHERSPTSSVYPLASPASTTDTPRGLPEPIEQAGRIESPQGSGERLHANARSPALQQPPSQHPLLPQPQGLQQTNVLPPIQQAAPRILPTYDQYRGPDTTRADPIFPGRDRSRSSFDATTRNTPPGPTPVTNRI